MSFLLLFNFNYKLFLAHKEKLYLLQENLFVRADMEKFSAQLSKKNLSLNRIFCVCVFSGEDHSGVDRVLFCMEMSKKKKKKED